MLQEGEGYPWSAKGTVEGRFPKIQKQLKGLASKIGSVSTSLHFSHAAHPT